MGRATKPYEVPRVTEGYPIRTALNPAGRCQSLIPVMCTKSSEFEHTGSRNLDPFVKALQDYLNPQIATFDAENFRAPVTIPRLV